RSLPNALAFDRNTGIMAHNTAFDRRVSWAAGVFRQTDSFGDSEGSNYNFSLRVTALPWMAQADHFVHVGAAYRNTNPENDELSFSAKPEAHNTVNFADTGTIAADGMNSLGAELAVVYGPLSFQSEYILASLDSADGTDPDFEGWYAYVSYWLTGESRPYKANHGVFGRVHPDSNYLTGEGYGAWEVGLRYSSLDLTDGSVDGGELSNVTVGMNWHLNASSRVMANYVHSELDERGLSDSENVDLVQLRFQVDF
ncbi:MAG: OprO/OprP family phosphate-selective porin, partial [Candidatus Binatia bacterium]